jgi:hypothetical protein
LLIKGIGAHEADNAANAYDELIDTSDAKENTLKEAVSENSEKTEMDAVLENSEMTDKEDVSDVFACKALSEYDADWSCVRTVPPIELSGIPNIAYPRPSNK